MSEFNDLFDEWGLDSEGIPLPLTVQTCTGQGSQGPILGEPVSLPGLPQIPQERLVRNSDGAEVVSSTAVYADLSLSDHFTLNSVVTPASGRPARLLTISRPDTFGLFGFLVLNIE